MPYSNNYENVRKMFWDGVSKGGKLLHLDRNGIEYCVKRALVDYMARTSKKEVGCESATVVNMFNSLSEGGFVDKIEKYFNEPVRDQKDYDVWHNECCKLFIDCMNQKIKKSETYGKAQKIVNMTMKTVYCLEGAKKFADLGYFDYCHMPLDSITLDWFRLTVARDWFNKNRAKSAQIRYGTEGGPLPKWGNIDFLSGSISYKFSDYEGNVALRIKKNSYHYMFFVTLIREFFKKGNVNNVHDGLTPFQAEFYIWPEWQWKTAAKNLAEQDLIKKLTANTGVSVCDPEIKKLIANIFAKCITLNGIY